MTGKDDLQPTLSELIGELIAPGRSRRAAAQSMDRLVGLSQQDQGYPDQIDRYLDQMLASGLSQLWESGWLPADVVHVAGRELKTAGSFLASIVISEQLPSLPHFSRAPVVWGQQLAEIIAGTGALEQGALGLPQHLPWTTRYCLETGSRRDAGWFDVIGLIGLWGNLSPLSVVTPPPSRWSRLTRPDRQAEQDSQVHTSVQIKMLGKVRALLAKAESTSYAAEAQALTAKAQDLMSRYRITDGALLSVQATSGIIMRRMHVAEPYAEMKAQLVAVVCSANQARAIWDPRYGMATIMGQPLDLDIVQMMAESLLVQSQHEMIAAGAQGKSPGFRRAFLLSYAARIGERLQEAQEHAWAQAEPGALVAQNVALDREFARQFPRATAGRSRQVDAAGWHAGRQSAESAALLAADSAATTRGQLGRQSRSHRRSRPR